MRVTLGDLLQKKQAGPEVKKLIEAATAAPHTGAITLRGRPEKIELVVTVLGALFPGQDVKIRARSREQRELLSGYWVWSMTEMRHNFVSSKEIFLRGPGRDPKEYRGTVRNRTMHWSEFLKAYKTLTGVEVAREHRIIDSGNVRRASMARR